MSLNQPSRTLYINNLDDKVHKEELRSQLYALFTQYGKIIDVVAMKSQKMRGQAFLVFTDLANATAAMRACEGMLFYDKPMHIDYAKTKSYATSRSDDPSFIPPSSANSSRSVDADGVNDKKRGRDDDGDAERQSKRDKTDDDDDDEEMEIDEDEDEEPPQPTIDSSGVPQTRPDPSARLLCTNLPQEVTNDVLSVLFQQYQGYKTINVTASPVPSTAGEKVKIAQVLFQTAELAKIAKEALNGFSLKSGWIMSVAYI